MVHFYTIDDGSGYRYRWGIEGDRDKVEQYLSTLLHSEYKPIRSYEFATSKPADKLCTGTKKLGNGLVSRFCKYAYTFTSRRDK